MLNISLFQGCLIIVLSAFLHTTATFGQTVRLSDSQAERIGRRIWQNESEGSISGLTAWNSGEKFASLGIGHFIWYPAGYRGPFEESFPRLLHYFGTRGVSVPRWLKGTTVCPWSTRAAFLADKEGIRMKELRSLLAGTIAIQARFLALRLESALPKILASVPAEKRKYIHRNFYRVAAEPLGMYALVDYVNFKGEGILLSERYNGEGWGLLQVLEGMGSDSALQEFSAAATRVLTRRVVNASSSRDEGRWLPGWKNRVRTYAD
jgi:hypothetical protein